MKTILYYIHFQLEYLELLFWDTFFKVEEKQPLQYLTEMREVTIQFINIVPATFDEERLIRMVDSAYQIVCNITSAVLGVVNKVSFRMADYYFQNLSKFDQTLTFSY